MENAKGVSPRENQQGEAPMENQQGKPLMEPLRSSFRSLSEYINITIHPAILHAITLLIPVNIYVIGDWLGAGIQWPLLRYQETYLGRNVISILTDSWYIREGIFHGRTALSTGIWILGAILLVLAFLIALSQERERLKRVRGYLILSGAVFFMIASVIQYGLFLSGPAGIAIPVGIPILLLLGLILLKGGEQEPMKEEGQETPRRSRQAGKILLLFIICFLVYNTVSFIRMSGDTTPAQMLPLSILRYGSLSLDQFNASFNNPDNLYAFVQVQGHYYSYFPIVTPVILTPLYVVPYLFITIFQIPLTYTVIADLARYASAMVAAAGVVLVYLNARALFSRTAVLLTTVTYAFGTTTWAISSQAPWQQGMVELLLAAMIFLVILNETRGEGSYLIPLGILSGLLVMARPPDAILILPVIWYAARYYPRQVHHYVIPGILSGLPFALYNILVFGSFFGGYQNNLGIFKFGPEAVLHFAGFLFAPNAGLFIFSPVLIFGILGYYCSRDIQGKRIREFLLLYGPAILLLVLLYSFYTSWVGAAYGPRFLTGLLPAYILYVGLFLDRTLRTPMGIGREAFLGAFMLLLLISITIQIIGAFYYPYVKDVGMDEKRVWDTGDLLILRSYRDGAEQMDVIRINSIPPFPPVLTLDLRGGRISPFVGELAPGGKAMLPGQNLTSSIR
ncbi:MAG TPA: hypothetical protein VMT31_04060 [Methanomicrobiales archaeon]|nr:hypothetical protein [Methanomicrobiales archaeon]